MNENTLEFLDRVAGPFWDRVRKQLDLWVGQYPATERQELISRLRASNSSFTSAYWELYLYHLVRAHGGSVECHPAVPGADTRPDFLVSGLSAEPFFLEAQVLGPPPAEAEAMRQGQEIWSGVNERVKSSTYLVRLSIEAFGFQQIAVARLARDTQRWLDDLDEAEVLGYAGYGLRPNPASLHWKDTKSGWELTLTPLVKDGDTPSDTLIGVGPSHFGMSTDTIDLRKALTKKYSKYGDDLGAPLVVAILGSRMGVDEIDVNQALFGDELYILDPDSDVPAQGSRKLNGIWRRRDGVRGTRLSGVLVAKNVGPWFMNESELALWLNPWADYPSDIVIGNVALYEVAAGELTTSPAARTNVEVFGLDPDWPGPEPAFPRR